VGDKEIQGECGGIERCGKEEKDAPALAPKAKRPRRWGPAGPAWGLNLVDRGIADSSKFIGHQAQNKRIIFGFLRNKLELVRNRAGSRESGAAQPTTAP